MNASNQYQKLLSEEVPIMGSSSDLTKFWGKQMSLGARPWAWKQNAKSRHVMSSPGHGDTYSQAPLYPAIPLLMDRHYTLYKYAYSIHYTYIIITYTYNAFLSKSQVGHSLDCLTDRRDICWKLKHALIFEKPKIFSGNRWPIVM